MLMMYEFQASCKCCVILTHNCCCSLLIGGPVPHYFYSYIHLLTKNPLGILLIERLIYMPCYQVLALYIIAILEVWNYFFSFCCKLYSKFYFDSYRIAIYTKLIYLLTMKNRYILVEIYLQGKSHSTACGQVQKLYQPLLIANLKYLTLLQYINIKYVPPMVM